VSISSDQTKLNRLTKEVASLIQKELAEQKKITETQKKVGQSNTALLKAKTAGQVQTAQSAISRLSKLEIASRTSENRYATQRLAKQKEISQLQEKIQKTNAKRDKDAQLLVAKNRQAEEKKAKTNAKVQAEKDTAASKENLSLRNIVSELREQMDENMKLQRASVRSFGREAESVKYDFFISHSSEDKEDFVSDLAASAQNSGLNVWYDKTSLIWGDSLRQSIDEGLRVSFFGVVVLSPNFFAKSWTQYELDGLIEKSLDGSGRLLPIWHRLTKNDLMNYAPSLVGKLALNTAMQSIDEIVAEMVKLRDRFIP
jgi:hypothetical protein